MIRMESTHHISTAAIYWQCNGKNEHSSVENSSKSFLCVFCAISSLHLPPFQSMLHWNNEIFPVYYSICWYICMMILQFLFPSIVKSLVSLHLGQLNQECFVIKIIGVDFGGCASHITHIMNFTNGKMIAFRSIFVNVLIHDYKWMKWHSEPQIFFHIQWNLSWTWNDIERIEGFWSANIISTDRLNQIHNFKW